MAEKSRKKELRQPDALQRAGLEASSWMEGKEKYVLGLIVAALVVGLGIAIADYVSDRGSKAAQADLGAALVPVLRPVAAPGAPEPAGDLPESERPFPSQREKDEAIVASLTGFRQAHKGTASAVTAALPLAQAHLRLGQYDQALAAYDAFLKGARPDDPLRAVALEGKGYAHEAKEDWGEAQKAFASLSGLGAAGFLEGMGEYHAARLLILQGKNDEAAKALAQIPGTHPETAAARLAKERMNVLASQGVKVPEPAKPAPKAAAANDGGTAG